MALQAAPGVVYTPTATKTPTPTNFISDSEYNLLTQYIPELESEITKRFNDQSVTGMLEALGKESAFQADLIKWNEEGRLTQLATAVTRAANVFTSVAHTFRVGETIVVRDVAGAVLRQGQITAVTADTFTALCGHASDWTAAGTTGIIVYADSNEFAKGSTGFTESLNSQVTQFTQAPVIIKEILKESRTNLALRTWVDTGEGYLWYYKNLNDTTMRFKNACERKLVMGQKWAGNLLASGVKGTEGLLAAASAGNIFAGPASDLDDFDEIIDRLNAQGGISENYMYNTSAHNRLIDRMLKAENVTGSSWGAFDNKETGLKLGFKDFNYGNYNFYKSSWRLLDDPMGEGSGLGATKYHGLMIPSGSKKVYDVMKGEAATNPFLHVKYRSSAEVNRKYELAIRDWAAGTHTSDVRETEFLSERALVLTGRNNCTVFAG